MLTRPPDTEAGAAGGEGDPLPDPAHDPHARRRRFPRWVRRSLAPIVALVVGMMLGAAALATFQASGVVPQPPVGGNLSAEASSDVILNLREGYLTRLAVQRAGLAQGPIPFENVRINVLPGQRLRLLGEIPFMGQRWQASAMMTVGVVQRRIRVDVRDAQVGALLLPIDLEALVAQPLNAELARLFEDGDFDVLDVATTEDRLVVRLAAKR